MSYRFLWKRVAAKAIASGMAQALLSLDLDRWWERAASSQAITPEQAASLKEEVKARLEEVASQGEKERELIGKVVEELVRELLKRGGRP